MKEFTSDFLDYAIHKLRESQEKVAECASRLSEHQIWHRPAPGVNSVGHLILHLSGSTRQWIGTGVAGLPDHRAREAEFAAAERSCSKRELLDRLSLTVEEMTRLLERVAPAALLETTPVRRYQLTKLRAVFHAVEHFSYHTGQIVDRVKTLVEEGQVGGDKISFDQRKTPDNFP